MVRGHPMREDITFRMEELPFIVFICFENVNVNLWIVAIAIVKQ